MSTGSSDRTRYRGCFLAPKARRGQRRLERLYDHGYLERKFLPVVIGEGRSPTLYIVDRKG